MTDLPKLLALAVHDNVAEKVSGAYTLSQEPFPYKGIWDPLGRVFETRAHLADEDDELAMTATRFTIARRVQRRDSGVGTVEASGCQLKPCPMLM